MSSTSGIKKAAEALMAEVEKMIEADGAAVIDIQFEGKKAMVTVQPAAHGQPKDSHVRLKWTELDMSVRQPFAGKRDVSAVALSASNADKPSDHDLEKAGKEAAARARTVATKSAKSRPRSSG